MLSIRSGRFRSAIHDFMVDLTTKMMDLRLQSKERWDALHAGEEISFDEIKDFWDRKDFELTFEQTYLIGQELKTVELAVDLLSKRNWCFVRAGGSNRFITSDAPVALYWKEGRKPGLYPPGLGVSETAVTFPLSPELTLHGTFEPIAAQHTVSDFQVALFNDATAWHSRRHFFARDKQFQIYTPAGIRPASDLQRIIKLSKKMAAAGEDDAAV